MVHTFNAGGLSLAAALALSACGGGEAPTNNANTQAVSVAIVGSGSVVSAGIVSCSTASCAADVPGSSEFTLTATPATGYKFTGWSGGCMGQQSGCDLTMSAAKSVTATFVPDTSALGCLGTPGSPTATPVLAATHPKLFFNDAQTAKCLKALAASKDPTFLRIKAFVDDEMAYGVNKTNQQYGYEDWFAALVYRVTGDTKYRDFAIGRTDYFVASELAIAAAGGTTQPWVARGWYLYAGEYLGGVATVYDWCFDGLNSSQKANWISYLNQGVYNLWNETKASWGGHPYPWVGWANTDAYNNYYYSFLHATMMVGVATEGENDQAANWRNVFRSKKIDAEVVPQFNTALPQGGSLEGTNYGVAMKTLFWTYDWWERSTGQRIADLTPHTLGSMAWMLHQTVPNTTYLVNLGDQSRDAHAWFFDYNRQYLLQTMALYPQHKLSGAASLMLASSSLPKMGYNWMSAWDFILKPAAMPEAHITDVSDAWYGSGVGELYTRGAWGDPSSALGMFKCGLQWESHQHFEQGAFQIYRGNWLAPVGNFYSNSGLEGSVSSANNVWFGDPAASDAPIQQTDRLGSPSKCNMLAVSDTGLYSYASADITPVYQGNANIARHQREFVFIKPSTFVVFDRAVATDSTVKRTWSIGLPTAPTVQGKQLTYVSPDHYRMDVYQVAPAGLGFKVGPHDWQSWGLNQEYASNPPQRADVVDTQGKASLFLNVISTSTGSAASSVASVAALSATDQTGVQVNLADGRVAYLYFNNGAPGGTIQIKNAAGAYVLGTSTQASALPSTITVPPLLKP